MCRPHPGDTAVAEETTTNNRTMFIVLALIAVAVVGGIAFYAGRHNALQNNFQVPQGQRAAAAHAPRFTRLPSKKFGNWTLACVQDARQLKHCSLVFQAVDSTRRHLLLRIAVIRTVKGQAALVVLTPPSALVAQGVKLTPGAGQAISVPFVRCQPRACQASTILTDANVSALGAADTTQATFVAATGRPVSYKLPTQGFKDGYAAWQSESPAPSGNEANTESAPATIPANGGQGGNGQ
jgi:invasion protein IalB